MKRMLIPALLFIVASGIFALGPQTLGSSHAVSGYDYKDMSVAVVVSPVEVGKMWLSANYSYPLLFSERDKLLEFVQASAKKIDIAISNKTTISFVQEIGRFYTDDSALVTVSFETHGYASSNTVVQLTNEGRYIKFLLNKEDTRDFIAALRSAHSLSNDYQTQVTLFK